MTSTALTPDQQRAAAFVKLRRALLTAAGAAGHLVECATTPTQIELARQAVWKVQAALFHYRQAYHEDKPLAAVESCLEEAHALHRWLRQIAYVATSCGLRETPTPEHRIRLAAEAAQLTYNLIDLLHDAGQLEWAIPAARSASLAVPTGDLWAAAWALKTLANTKEV
jgi:hypothetical protein